MPVHKKYKQLKFSVDALKDQYHAVYLSFRLHQKPVTGVLNGSANDWTFSSESPSFMRHVPCGALHKYQLWHGHVPKNISAVYNGIIEAAFKAGYELNEREVWEELIINN